MTVMRPLSEFFSAAQKGKAVGKAAELSVPIRFLNDLNGAATRADILGVYSIWSKRLTGSDRCSIALDDGDGCVIITAMNGTSGIPQGTRHSVHDTVVGEVFRRKQPIYLPDVSVVDLSDARIVKSMGYSSAVMVPIIGGRQCFGTLNATFIKTLEDHRATLAMLEAMASCLATQLLVVDQMEDLARLARTDPLTGAFNRYHLYGQTNEIWAEWRNTGQPFAFIAADIDLFKSVNDLHGHDAGDQVLRHMVKRMQSRSRAGDDVIRLGGEEFGILLRDTTLNMAHEICKRMHDGIRATPFEICQSSLNITASFGVSQANASDGSVDDTLKRADAALYLAKTNGRDQIVLAPDDGLLSA